MILNDTILHDSQEFAAALALEAKKKEGKKKEDRRPATGKKKVISDDTE